MPTCLALRRGCILNNMVVKMMLGSARLFTGMFYRYIEQYWHKVLYYKEGSMQILRVQGYERGGVLGYDIEGWMISDSPLSLENKMFKFLNLVAFGEKWFASVCSPTHSTKFHKENLLAKTTFFCWPGGATVGNWARIIWNLLRPTSLDLQYYTLSAVLMNLARVRK